MSRPDALTGHSPEMDPRILEEAADWLLRADAGEIGGPTAEELNAWRRRSSDHERAWQAACKLKAMLGSVPPELGAATLGRHRMDRRSLLKSLATLAVLPTAGWLGYTRLPWASWTADIRTAKGEQRTITLPDGGELMVNTDSGVDIAYNQSARIIQLHHGEIQVISAPDPAVNPRPLLVETGAGQIRALGTTFIVRAGASSRPHESPRGHARYKVTVLKHAVAIRPHWAEQEIRIQAGQQAVFSAHQIQAVQNAPSRAHAWVKGQLIADEQHLGDFISELARYRPGILRCDPAVANLRISGVFQLKNTDQALDILASTLPVRINRLTDYWVTVTER